MSARQAENGFVRGRIVSSQHWRRNIRGGKASDFNEAKNENKNLSFRPSEGEPEPIATGRSGREAGAAAPL
jgi:hypothetical protein